ncbi:MAG TPA: cysteine desulfurase-like protein [Candidatus Baltobacteraceae bacterium]|nr:cysteine desulfurase-like protein [Candidatus Baltobacteraceae bacterium]
MSSTSSVVRPFPIESVREQFPSLRERDGAAGRIYLDNPAGTQVPRAVIDAVTDFYRRSNGNLGGFFSTSHAAQDLLHRAYGAAATFVGGACEREIVIGQSMTALTFSFSRSLARMFGPGDEVVVTRMDHDSNIAPWLAMAQERGMKVRWVPFDTQTWRIEPAALESVLSNRTKIVALNYASNLSGSINDVRTLTKLAHSAGALVYVDAVQFAPHRLVEAPALECDFLLCSAYKFYGPHTGVLWAREELLESLYAYKVRPLPQTLPDKYEVGTPQLELLAGLEACIGYYAALGESPASGELRRASIEAAYREIHAWESALTARLLEGLQALPGLTVRGITDAQQLQWRVPTVSFTHASRSSASIARAMADRGIFVWSGHNFALELSRALGLDDEDGVVRIGMAHYNTPEEIDTAIGALAEILG